MRRNGQGQQFTPVFPLYRGDVLKRDAALVTVTTTHLKRYLVFPTSVEEGVTLLQQLDGERIFYQLYRHYFPQEWSRSTEGIYTPGRKGYAPRESEFLRLVAQQLFPLDVDYMEDMAAEGEYLDRIQLIAYATDWFEDPWEFTPPWQLLLLVADTLLEHDALGMLDDLADDYLEPSLLIEIKRWAVGEARYSLLRLEERCQHQEGPLAHLAMTFSMMRYATGNEWHDVPGSEGALPFDKRTLCWCEQHIDMLSQSFAEAKEMERGMYELVAWLEGDPNRHMRSLLALLTDASV